MDDLIRRQDVIDVASCYIDLCNKALDSLSLGGRDRYAIETERNSLLHLKDDMKSLPSAQPELIEKSAYIRGFEQGRTQGMIDSQGWKKYVTDAISRQEAIDAVYKSSGTGTALKALKALPSAQPDMAENLYLYKCYITDKDGLQHEVVHTDDIRRVTGWEI